MSHFDPDDPLYDPEDDRLDVTDEEAYPYLIDLESEVGDNIDTEYAELLDREPDLWDALRAQREES